ncbi:MAG: hypothetical protein RRC34_12870 [Lentisphaeria bacterium]|nr:hypothetical protein [Lentisphaeria bacterium]
MKLNENLLKKLTLWAVLALWFIMTGLNPSAMAGDELPGGVTAASFQTPPNEYRVVQYQLTPDTLKEYPEWGIGGYMAFFYSVLYPECERENYRLAEKGSDIIGKLVDAAHKDGSPVWLADDWGYPSGMAGGRVVAGNPDFEVRSLVMLTQKGGGKTAVNFELPDGLHDIVYAALYPALESGIDVTAGKRVATQQRKISAPGLTGSWELRVFARYTRRAKTQAQSTMKQFGHTGRYPDLMNREAMASFIDTMHAPILARITDPETKVEGFYCNEPNLMQTHWERSKALYACAPWSGELPARFKAMHGYELDTILPYIFEGSSDDARRARIHYRQAVADLLTDSFSRQIRAWCDARGIKSSGHFLLNEYLSQHVQGYGDLMKFVSEFDVPALDIPIPNPDQFMDFPYQQSRFFSSVTAWKKRDATLMLLDPIIGGYGMGRLSPDLPLLLNSVNMASFHGVSIFSSYMPRVPSAEAKGYSKEQYRFLNEYIGRLTQVLRGAKREAGVALYYPIAMFQADLLASDQFWPDIVKWHKHRQNDWDTTEKALLDHDIDYMIVHPEGVAEGAVADGRIRIGDGTYHTLVMPQMEFLPLAAARQLQTFHRGGGTVLWVDQVPRRAEHAKNDAAVQAILQDMNSVNVPGLAAAIPHSHSRAFDLNFSPGPAKLRVGRFYRDGLHIYLLVNRLQEIVPVDIRGGRGDGAGRVTVLDPSTGKITSIELPRTLVMGATRALILIPDQTYIAQNLLTIEERQP